MSSPTEDLARALVAWRKAHDPRLGDLIERIGRTIPMPAIEGRTKTEKFAAWETLARKRDPNVLSRLVEYPWPKKAGDLYQMVAHLLQFEDDPRLATALADFVATHHEIDTRNARSLVDSALKRLMKISDTRVLERLEQLEKTGDLAHLVGALRIRSERAQSAKLDELVGELAAKYPGESPADTSTGDALLAQIYADPDNDAPLLVYADWLAERGDPQGEFIQLQLTGKPAEPQAKWVGAMARYFLDNFQFARGMFVGGRLGIPTGERPETIFDEPGWPMIRHLEFDRVTSNVDEKFLSRPELSRIRTLGDVTLATAAKLDVPRPALVELHLRRWRDSPPLDPKGPLGSLAMFPNLITLGLGGVLDEDEDFEAWAKHAPIVERVERLIIYEIGVGGDRVPDEAKRFVPLVAARGGALREVILGSPPAVAAGGWSFELARTKAPGPFDACVARHRGSTKKIDPVGYPYYLAEGLSRLPTTVKTLTIEHVVEPEASSSLDAALAKLRGVKVTTHGPP